MSDLNTRTQDRTGQDSFGKTEALKRHVCGLVPGTCEDKLAGICATA